MSSDTNNVPKQELLLKLLKMTTSANDGECLTAIRKANALLSASSWDWDMLMHSKIRIIEDPFKNLTTPPATRNGNGSSPAYTKPPTPSTPRPPPPPPRRGSVADPISSTPNRFPGFCWCCGNESVTGTGFIFKPSPSHAKWEVVCTPCNTSATINSFSAPQKRKPRSSAVSSLA